MKKEIDSYLKAFLRLLIFVITLIPTFSCSIEYAGEEFNLMMNTPNKLASLTIYVKDFGSYATEDIERNKDLELMRNLAVDDELKAKMERTFSIKILSRTLSYTSYSTGIYIHAVSDDYKNLLSAIYEIYSYKIENGKIYLIPKNQDISRAQLDKNGKLIKHQEQLTFRWPIGVESISFVTEYKIKGESFKKELNKKFGR